MIKPPMKYAVQKILRKTSKTVSKMLHNCYGLHYSMDVSKRSSYENPKETQIYCAVCTKKRKENCGIYIKNEEKLTAQDKGFRRRPGKKGKTIGKIAQNSSATRKESGENGRNLLGTAGIRRMDPIKNERKTPYPTGSNTGFQAGRIIYR
ncbi:MAG: hypothetical protein LKI32_00420 [Lachnospiraceae bacterium]|jgi:hypothetical protein|nr:hypothetical protein [Lachnospiraceae bacterium]MCI1656009.1 hypothetical protein [Lachnospiraceae bacterium]MCI2194491.1 hypothetical protein [Lachnospiraceae bacterium]